jgi:GDP-L-fucose synthase
MEKLNILITGPDGFLAKELRDYLGRDYKVLDCPRFDVTDEKELERILLKYKPVDVVIHTAVRGGKRTKEDSFQDMLDNLSMAKNLLNHRDKYGVLFSFCSGAAFDRNGNIRNLKESAIRMRAPYDYYGLSKNIISREMLNYDGVFTFRLFGCFGRHEDPSRFFSSVWHNVNNFKPVEIHQDKEMDFFWAQDVGKVVEFYFLNYNKIDLPKDLNLTYSPKLTLSQLTEMFLTIMSPRALKTFEKPGGALGSSYTGNCEKLDGLNIELGGLVKGFVESFKGELI